MHQLLYELMLFQESDATLLYTQASSSSICCAPDLKKGKYSQIFPHEKVCGGQTFYCLQDNRICGHLVTLHNLIEVDTAERVSHISKISGNILSYEGFKLETVDTAKNFSKITGDLSASKEFKPEGITAKELMQKREPSLYVSPKIAGFFALIKISYLAVVYHEYTLILKAIVRETLNVQDLDIKPKIMLKSIFNLFNQAGITEDKVKNAYSKWISSNNDIDKIYNDILHLLPNIYISISDEDLSHRIISDGGFYNDLILRLAVHIGGMLEQYPLEVWKLQVNGISRIAIVYANKSVNLKIDKLCILDVGLITMHGYSRMLLSRTSSSKCNSHHDVLHYDKLASVIWQTATTNTKDEKFCTKKVYIK